MSKGTQGTVAEQAGIDGNGALEGLLREGARRMLLQAVEAEVEEYIDRPPRDGSRSRATARRTP